MVMAKKRSLVNRTQRKELARRLRSDDPGLDVMHPNAAGIDVGNSAHYVAGVRIAIPNRCAGLSASPPTCIACGLVTALWCEDCGDAIHGCLFCAEQRIDREGSSPSGAQMRSAVSKSGDNTSLAGESGRYGEA
jgi:hypothetical protein